MLLVDAGDFGAVGDFEPDRKTAFLFDLMAWLGYDAVTPGERELTRGLPAVKAIYAAHPEVKVVSANVMDASGNRIWPEYAVLEKGGIRIGVTGVTGENFYAFNLSRGIQKVDDFTFEDPRSALQRVIPELRRQADVVVVLLHEARSGAGSLVAEVPRVDVAVVGHTPGSGTDVEAAGATLVLRPGMRGRYLPVLDLTLGADHRILGYAGKGRRLDENVARNPEVDGVVTSWVKAWNLRKSGAVSHRGSKPR